MELYAAYRQVRHIRKAHNYLRYDAPDPVRLGYDAVGKGLYYGGRIAGLEILYGATTAIPYGILWKLPQSLWYVGAKGIDRTVAGVLAGAWKAGTWGLSKCTSVQARNYGNAYRSLRGWLDWARPSRNRTVEGWTPYGFGAPPTVPGGQWNSWATSPVARWVRGGWGLVGANNGYVGTPQWQWQAPALPVRPVEAFDTNKVYKGMKGLNLRNLQQAEFNTWFSKMVVQGAGQLGASITSATTDGQPMAADGANAQFSDALRELFEPFEAPVEPAVVAAAQVMVDPAVLLGPRRTQALAAAADIMPHPNADQQATINATIASHDSARAMLKRAAVFEAARVQANPANQANAGVAAARNIVGNHLLVLGNDIDRAIQAAVANPFRVLKEAVKLETAKAEAVVGGTGRNIAIALLGFNPANGSPLATLIQATVANPNAAIAEVNDAKQTHGGHMDHLLAVFSRNINNVMQRDFERQEAQETLKQIIKMYLKDLYLEIKYGYMKIKNEFKNVADKALARLFGLLQEVDPLYGREQGSSTVI